MIDLIFQEAYLNIIDFDIHRRRELNGRGRIFPFYVLSYIKEGSCRVNIHGESYYAGAHEAVLLPPDTKHDHVKERSDPTTFMWFYFTFTVAGCFDVLQMFDLPIKIDLRNYYSRFEELFSEYFAAYQAGQDDSINIHHVIYQRAKALELMALLVEALFQHVDQSSFRTHYRTDLTGIFVKILQKPECITSLKDLGREHNIHPTYLSNKFRRTFGISPIKLKNSVIVERAKALLRKGDISIAEVGLKLGYDDPNYFTHFFKNQVGVAPSKYVTTKG